MQRSARGRKPVKTRAAASPQQELRRKLASLEAGPLAGLLAFSKSFAVRYPFDLAGAKDWPAPMQLLVRCSARYRKVRALLALMIHSPQGFSEALQFPPEGPASRDPRYWEGKELRAKMAEVVDLMKFAPKFGEMMAAQARNRKDPEKLKQFAAVMASTFGDAMSTYGRHLLEIDAKAPNLSSQVDKEVKKGRSAGAPRRDIQRVALYVWLVLRLTLRCSSADANRSVHMLFRELPTRVRADGSGLRKEALWPHNASVHRRDVRGFSVDPAQHDTGRIMKRLLDKLA